MKAILIIAGPSAVGKTTVAAQIVSDSEGFEYVRSATTRAARGDGRDAEYIYLSKEEFLSRIKSRDMLEYTEYSGNLYGTPREEIDRIFSLGKIPVLVLDINGVASLKGAGGDFSVFSFYIWDTPDVIERRLYERMLSDKSDNREEVFKGRVAANIADLLQIEQIAPLFDLLLKNENIQATKEKILSELKRLSLCGTRDEERIEKEILEIKKSLK